MSDKPRIIFTAEVAEALAANRAVVALESTVIAHGLPRPVNLETARRMEATVRESGATPATIAVLGGRIHAGLGEDELNHLASDDRIRKLSIRDLPLAVARGWDGATTVASTAWIACKAGIRVFATGGIGGVHRGCASDVSADLPILARMRVVVVCAGAKSVLDLAATREWLETHGVTLVGFGTNEMPAFYSRASGLAVDARAGSAQEVAAIVRARDELGLSGATLVAVPVPAADEVPSHIVEEAIETAHAEAGEQGIGGKDLTPFLLSRLASITGGATLRANVSLLGENARVAAAIASELCSG